MKKGITISTFAFLFILTGNIGLSQVNNNGDSTHSKLLAAGPEYKRSGIASMVMGEKLSQRMDYPGSIPFTSLKLHQRWIDRKKRAEDISRNPFTLKHVTARDMRLEP